MKRIFAAAAILVLLPATARAQADSLAIGETFVVRSEVLGEDRRINVYVPPSYQDSIEAPRPVLYMPDGGIAEDFLHIAGLLQISVLNGTMRPFILVGIENTQRRRDMTGPTTNDEDRKIAPQVGGSAAFRKFIRTELMPVVDARYRTTREKAIIGESLAGLFVVETLLLEPHLFDTYIAIDPSLWWNNGTLAGEASARGLEGKTILLASSAEEEISRLTRALADRLRGTGTGTVHYLPMQNETHGTIYHPAALAAVRMLFKPGEGTGHE